MAKLVCGSCGAEEKMPRHCGQDMQLATVDGREMLVCHMGPDCGKQEIPQHHGAPMKIAA